jgi:molybdenum cofactor biosynthesis enzyme MoaA
MNKTESIKAYSFSENPYQSIVVDITNRCNLDCGYCYNPDRSQSDMSMEAFERLCSELPSQVLMKLSGGEPTLHPGLADFTRIAHDHGHLVYIISNGIRYTEPGFLDTLVKSRESGSRFSIGMSMDGGYSNRRAYEIINGKDCMKQKLDSFRALVNSGLTRVCLTAVIVRGLNEDVIPQLVELAMNNSKAVRYLHIRNAGNVGRWDATDPYTLEDLVAMTRGLFTEDQFRQQCVAELHCPSDSGRNCCYRFRPTSRLQISLLEFYTKRAALCPKRGRIKVGSDKIEPLFQSMDNPPAA